jgi:hypothetical protein
MNKQIVIQLDPDLLADIEECCPGTTLNQIKTVAIEAIVGIASGGVATKLAVEQAEARKVLAKELHSKKEARIIKLGKLNQIPQE